MTTTSPAAGLRVDFDRAEVAQLVEATDVARHGHGIVRLAGLDFELGADELIADPLEALDLDGLDVKALEVLGESCRTEPDHNTQRE